MLCANKRYVHYLIRLSLSHALYSIDEEDYGRAGDMPEMAALAFQ
jgi:hypothetical protein